jgi:hypothetical protein
VSVLVQQYQINIRQYQALNINASGSQVENCPEASIKNKEEATALSRVWGSDTALAANIAECSAVSSDSLICYASPSFSAWREECCSSSHLGERNETWCRFSAVENMIQDELEKELLGQHSMLPSKSHCCDHIAMVSSWNFLSSAQLPVLSHPPQGPKQECDLPFYWSTPLDATGS